MSEDCVNFVSNRGSNFVSRTFFFFFFCFFFARLGFQKMAGKIGGENP